MAINTVDVQGLNLVDPLGVPLTGDYQPGNNTSKPRFRVHNNKLILYISNTLINQFFQKGNEKEYCPRRVFESSILNKYRTPPSLAMLKGSYFETKCIGGGAGDSKVDHLPLTLKGKITKDQERIDQQVVVFKMLCEEYGIIISDDKSNIQIKEMKHYAQSNWLDIEVFITGESDIISPINNYKGFSFDNSIIDLKLTGDLTSTWGDFAWSPKEFINTQQLTVYHLLFDMPTFFWVFDYKAKGPEHMLLPVNHDTNHKNPNLANKAKYRISSTHEVIRKTINEIAHNFIEGWVEKPNTTNCDKCPVPHCAKRNMLNEL